MLLTSAPCSIPKAYVCVYDLRLFMYYHTLANQQQQPAGDGVDGSSGLPSLDKLTDESQKTWLWFPLFSFFESGVGGGKIPNEVSPL